MALCDRLKRRGMAREAVRDGLAAATLAASTYRSRHFPSDARFALERAARPHHAADQIKKLRKPSSTSTCAASFYRRLQTITQVRITSEHREGEAERKGRP